MLILIGIALLFSLLLFWLARRQRRELGLPSGRIIYADTASWGALEEPLYDPTLGLAGRPDYLAQHGDTIIPVEVKSSQVSAGPYDAHIYQLAAYCWLVERVYEKRPPYGILHYANRTYAIDYTPQLEAALKSILEAMRLQERHKEVARSHESAARCVGCGYRAVCDQKLRA